jgi:hypothetical protein
MDQPDLEFNPPAFQAIVLMADAVQVSDGKLFILGGGLGVIGPRPQNIAVAVRIAVPWDQANVKHQWKLDLIDEDGRPVTINNKSIAIAGQFEAGRPAGVAPGTALWVPLGLNFGAIPLPGGKRYTWQLSINDATAETWNATFAVRKA